jgi:hypothetical protein
MGPLPRRPRRDSTENAPSVPPSRIATPHPPFLPSTRRPWTQLRHHDLSNLGRRSAEDGRSLLPHRSSPSTNTRTGRLRLTPCRSMKRA